ncbi:MAG: anti-sigma factor [Rhodoferax sp.]|nr:anti-sigma factor [Rhodoferax sp.]MDP3654608.1 anti-sigma factor [Rhodoferax sp.]
MKYTHPALLDHLASAYVLGTLGGGARRRFERLLHDRSDVRMQVALWEARLGQLAVSIPERSPSPRLWSAIEARTRPGPAPAVTGAAAPGLRWLKPAGLGFGSFALGVLALGVLFVSAPALFISSDQLAMRSGEKLPQSYVGLLTDAQGQGKLLVSSLRHGKTLTVKVIGPITPPAGGRLVLWALPASGAALALGAVPSSGTAVSVLPDTSEKLLSQVSKLQVTLETDGTPAHPSGTVVFSGNCAKLW